MLLLSPTGLLSLLPIPGRFPHLLAQIGVGSGGFCLGAVSLAQVLRVLRRFLSEPHLLELRRVGPLQRPPGCLSGRLALRGPAMLGRLGVGAWRSAGRCAIGVQGSAGRLARGGPPPRALESMRPSPALRFPGLIQRGVLSFLFLFPSSGSPFLGIFVYDQPYLLWQTFYPHAQIPP
jgi:hypothetical protein